MHIACVSWLLLTPYSGFGYHVKPIVDIFKLTCYVNNINQYFKEVAMSADNRDGSLKVFRIVCTVTWVVALLFTLVAAYQSITRIAPYLAQASSPDMGVVRSFYGALLASAILEIVQALLCVALLQRMSCGNPFRRSTSFFLLLLGATLLVKTGAGLHLAHEAISQLGFIGTSEFGDLLRGIAPDTSALFLGVFLILLSFLFRYGRELFLDSEEMI